jgi:hypothetical protein
MGQKTNPTALRLNKTNKRFDSLWYNKLHYGRLLGDELVIKSHIEQVLAQANIPKNLWSFSPFFKRGRGLVLYLSCDKSRAVKSTKLRLRRFAPLLHENTSTLHNQSKIGLQEVKPIQGLLSDKGASVNLFDPYHLKEKSSLPEKRTLALQEKRLLVHSVLALLMSNTSSRSKALLHNDLSLFQKAKTFLWMQGDGQAVNLLWHRLEPSTNPHIASNYKTS